MTLSTPFGMPARSPSSAMRERRVGRLARGLDHHRAARSERRPGLARDHRVREIPRRDQRRDPDRLLDDDDALVGPGRRDRVAVDALRFLGEPFDERSAVGDLAARLGERLALLGGEDLREVLLVRHHQVEPLAQDARALLAGLRAPRRPGALGRIDGAPRLLGAQLRHRAEHTLRRGVAHRDRVRAAYPLAADVALLSEELRILQGKCSPMDWYRGGLGGCVHECLQRRPILLPAHG